MKTQTKKKSVKRLVLLAITLSFVTYEILMFALVSVNSFFKTHELKRKPLIEIKLNFPLEIVKRQARLIKQVEAQEVSPTPLPSPTPISYKKNPTDKEIAAYIKSKDWDYSIAIRLAKSENFYNYNNHFDCSRTGGVNPDGTRDHGLWQINDIHIHSGAITLENANDCYKATDFAYGLYVGRGRTFEAWSAYNNKSYLTHNEYVN